MLALPSRGIARSVSEHNSKLEVSCDWLEGSILFFENEISRTDIVDILTEDRIYDKQDFANEWVDNVWAELRRRQKCLGAGTPFVMDSHRIRRKFSWEDASAHGFCLMLSLVQYYSGLNQEWEKKFKGDYNEQGELFELLTKESLENQFSGWSLYRTGWSRSAPSKLNGVVDKIAKLLGESKGDLKKWTSPDANEEGLDLLFYRPFVDTRVGIPVYLVQCASGGNWEGKLKTPDLAIWTTIVQFAAPPAKAFSTPLSFTDHDFVRYTKKAEGMLIDRYRLLIPASHDTDWVSKDLKERVNKWIKPRIATFPTL